MYDIDDVDRHALSRRKEDRGDKRMLVVVSFAEKGMRVLDKRISYMGCGEGKV